MKELVEQKKEFQKLKEAIKAYFRNAKTRDNLTKLKNLVERKKQIGDNIIEKCSKDGRLAINFFFDFRADTVDLLRDHFNVIARTITENIVGRILLEERNDIGQLESFELAVHKRALARRQIILLAEAKFFREFHDNYWKSHGTFPKLLHRLEDFSGGSNEVRYFKDDFKKACKRVLPRLVIRQANGQLNYDHCREFIQEISRLPDKTLGNKIAHLDFENISQLAEIEHDTHFQILKSMCEQDMEPWDCNPRVRN